MDKISFENGTLVTPAKVTINGVEHEVTPAVYSGETPLSAENLNQMQNNTEDAISALKIEILKTVFSIGSTYITPTNTNPSTILGFGTWERVKGKVLVGLDEDDEDFNEIGKEVGSKYLQDHIHKEEGGSGNLYYQSGSDIVWINRPLDAESPYHSFAKDIVNVDGTDTQTGNGGNIQPSKVVGYMWLRTA